MDDTTTYLQQLVVDLDRLIDNEAINVVDTYDRGYCAGLRFARLIAAKARDEELS